MALRIGVSIFLLSLSASLASADQPSCQMRFSELKPDAMTADRAEDPNAELLKAISGKDPKSDRAPASFSANNKQNLINRKLPPEFASCPDTPEVKTAVWYEFLRGLSKIESDGKCTDAHGDVGSFGGKGSDGLFQMTKGDGCGGKGNGGHGELTNANDYKENIACAVGTWSQMIGDGKSIIGNPYWGPCKRGDDKCKQIIETVNKQFCQGNSANVKPDSINWDNALGNTKNYRSGAPDPSNKKDTAATQRSTQ